ncbi:MAG: hypothetical protein K6G24_00770 [Lachnospiraceae bacterium]|nr:hypothetical protein [Lachnospiraceae bacterium]
MDDIAEIISDLNKVVVLQSGMIERLTLKLLEYMEMEEIEKMCVSREEVNMIINKWKP